MESLKYKKIGEELISKIPEFKGFLEEHVKDHGEVLPHILMGDFTRFFVETFKEDKESDLLRRCVEFVDSLFASGDEMLEELGHVSFVENLQGEENIDEMRNLFSEKVKKAFSQIF